MKAKFIRDIENPIDSLNIGNELFRKSNLIEKEIKLICKEYNLDTNTIKKEINNNEDGIAISFEGKMPNLLYPYRYFIFYDTIRKHYWVGYENINNNEMENQIPKNSLEDCVMEIKIFLNKFNYYAKGNKIKESLNFERTNPPLDKLQIGKFQERQLKKKGDEIEPFLEKVRKGRECSEIKTIINLESDIIQKSFIFYDKINNLEPVFYISYYGEYLKERKNSSGFYAGFYVREDVNSPYKGDEIDYDTLERCVNKLLYWVENYKNYL